MKKKIVRYIKTLIGFFWVHKKSPRAWRWYPSFKLEEKIDKFYNEKNQKN